MQFDSVSTFAFLIHCPYSGMHPEVMVVMMVVMMVMVMVV